MTPATSVDQRASARPVERTMLLWCPDWPARAAAVELSVPMAAPMIVIDKGMVYCANRPARVEGVRRGMRLRDAQSRCPGLVVGARDDGLAQRLFEPVLERMEAFSPGVQVSRPGMCLVKAGGPSSYHQGEVNAAAVLAQEAVAAGVVDCRIGVADGSFTAEQAARQADPQDSRIVDPGASAAFLSELPVSVLGRPELATLLRRLGLTTLGAFAALPAPDILTRFGSDGLHAHRLARGLDTSAVVARRPPPELVFQLDLEPPLRRVEQVAFSVRQTAELLVTTLTAHHLVATSVLVDVRTDRDELHERLWVHPRWFTANDIVDRVRWQLGGATLDGPVASVRLEPMIIDPASSHHGFLWGGAPDERVQRAMARVQGLLGHEGVQTVVPSGGRSPAARQTTVAWGDQPVGVLAATRPWPGQVPDPAPTTLYPEPLPTAVLDVHGKPVAVSERGVLSSPPATLTIPPSASGAIPHERETPTTQVVTIDSWAGPWPLDERWWDPARAQRVARLQVVGLDGSAWLVLVRDGDWFLEATYD